MKTQYQKICKREIRRVALYYKSRCWWANFADMEQQGWMHALEIIDQKSEIRTDTFGAYLARALSRLLSNYCYGQSSALSSGNRPGKWLASIQHVPIDVNTQLFAYDFECEIIAAEAAALVPHLRRELRLQMLKIYNEECAAGELDGPEACMRVLVDGDKPGAVAKQMAVPVAKLYRETARVKSKALVDESVRNILAQLEERRRDQHAYIN